MFKRTLDLSKFKSSFFLFGPRQAGKTFLIKNTLEADIYIDLLKQSEYLRYAKNVSLLSSEVAALGERAKRVIIDEIQRCPDLLNEVQSIMDERSKTQFVLTGSSARKLKRSGVNLLGGRAIIVHLYPLTKEEMGGKFDLFEALRFGTIPSVVSEPDKEEKIRKLKSYVEVYLKEEIQQESLARDIPAYARFLELAAHENGNILNFQNIARETGVHSKTVKEYFHILEDTLLGFFLFPYGKSPRTKIVSHPKFYFFDPGVVSALKGELSSDLSPGTAPFGRAFEHFVILEIKRTLEYRESEAKMSFFRTSDGAEVDLVLEFGGEIWAIEVKASLAPRSGDVRGLKSFMNDHKFKRAVCVCQSPRSFKENGIEFVPWQDFIKQLSAK